MSIVWHCSRKDNTGESSEGQQPAELIDLTVKSPKSRSPSMYAHLLIITCIPAFNLFIFSDDNDEYDPFGNGSYYDHPAEYEEARSPDVIIIQ